MTRGTTNTNSRGSAETRRWRKLMLLTRDGDGIVAPCRTCGRLVGYHSMVVDCWPVPRCEGGRYDGKRTPPEQSNNAVQCAPCSHAQGGALGTQRRRSAEVG